MDLLCSYNNGELLLQDDIKLMKKIGLNSYRFSISWPRILPSKIIATNLNPSFII